MRENYDEDRIVVLDRQRGVGSTMTRTSGRRGTKRGGRPWLLGGLLTGKITRSCPVIQGRRRRGHDLSDAGRFVFGRCLIMGTKVRRAGGLGVLKKKIGEAGESDGDEIEFEAAQGKTAEEATTEVETDEDRDADVGREGEGEFVVVVDRVEDAADGAGEGGGGGQEEKGRDPGLHRD